MNRLILVGNGFDLAHGLKTSYRDFIDDFWQNKFCEILDFIKVNNSDKYIDKLIILNNCNRLPKNLLFTNFKSFIEDLKYYGVSLKFNNNFLKLITEKCYENWVDIENEYYNELKKVKDGDILPIPTSNKVDKLNQDFNDVKLLLIKYLFEIEKVDVIDAKICDKIYSFFKLKDFSLEAIKTKIKIEHDKRKADLEAIESQNITINEVTDDLEEISILQRLIGGNKETEIRDMIESEKINFLNSFKMIPEDIVVLNFNYTETPWNYITTEKCNKKDIYINVNSIHGNLNEREQNPIIFGFGDDVDKKYQEFEDLNDNRYLENFKSIAYTQTDNYKRLLEFVEAKNYQVFIFGHSCGISDRTMLNTIFEHDNCKSVKPFYHKREDGSDNYTEIVQNISRNFNDKKKFRDRVVNKTYCEPLS